MNDIINSIINTPIPTIFVVVGILLLFLAIGGQFTTKVITANVKPKHAGVLGSLFLILGLALHAMPVLVPIQKPPDQKSVTIPAPVIKPPVKDLKSDNKQDYTNTYYRDKADLNEARKVGTVDAYETFIKRHSRSDWKETAIYYRDEAALSVARKVGTVDAYDTFIMSYPKSDWKKRQSIIVTKLHLMMLAISIPLKRMRTSLKNTLKAHGKTKQFIIKM